MAELLPNWLQENCYPAQYDRLLVQNLAAVEGVADMGGGSLLVTTGGADLDLSVAQGGGFVEGDDDDRGMYSIYNDAPVTLTATAANPTNPRIDQVIARVYDSTYGEGADEWVLEMLDGTATGGATLTNLNGATALPDNSIRLAYILVPATFTGPFVNATHILDARVPTGDGLWVSYNPEWFGYQNGVPTVQNCRYNRVGNMVTVEYSATFDAVGSAVTAGLFLPRFLPAADDVYTGHAAYITAAANLHILYIHSINSPASVAFVTDGSNSGEVGPAAVGDRQTGSFVYETTA